MFWFILKEVRYIYILPKKVNPIDFLNKKFSKNSEINLDDTLFFIIQNFKTKYLIFFFLILELTNLFKQYNFIKLHNKKYNILIS